MFTHRANTSPVTRFVDVQGRQHTALAIVGRVCLLGLAVALLGAGTEGRSAYAQPSNPNLPRLDRFVPGGATFYGDAGSTNVTTVSLRSDNNRDGIWETLHDSASVANTGDWQLDTLPCFVGTIGLFAASTAYDPTGVSCSNVVGGVVTCAWE